MPTVKRVTMPEPITVLLDGYLYEWTQPGQDVDVLEQHRKSLLAHKGARLIDVELIDQPVLLPTVLPGPPPITTTVPPDVREPDEDLTGAYIDPKTVEDEPPAPVVELATVAPEVVPEVGDLWSDADKIALAERLLAETGGG